MEYIEFKDVAISYGSYEAIKQISFSVKKSAIITLFGPSGCGKSSLMKALLGVISLKRGDILIDGKDNGLFTDIIGYVPQDNQLLPWMNLYDNIDLWRKESQNQDPNATNEIIKLVGLTGHEKKLPHELSGGMMRRAALGRGLVTRTRIICFDEVLVSIERRLRQSLMVNIRNYIKANNITTIIISHDYEEAVFMSDEIFILSTGPTEIIKKIVIDKDERGTLFFDSLEFDEASLKMVS